MKKYQAIFFAALALLGTPSIAQEGTSHLERRLALDIGSGKVKMLLADVDTKTDQITTLIFADATPLGLIKDLEKSPDGRFSKEIQNEAANTLSKLIQKAAPFKPQAIHVVATEAFRLAQNGPEMALFLEDQLGVHIDIISQEEEGILGFITATSIEGVDPENALVWDMGSGSFQITAKSQDEYFVHKAKLGKVPVRNAIISKIQNKDLSKVQTPNPMSSDDVIGAVLWVENNLEEAPLWLQKKLQSPETVFLGLSAHPKVLRNLKHDYTPKIVFEEIQKRLSLTDEQIFTKDASPYDHLGSGDWPSFIMSDLSSVYATMCKLGIKNVHYVSTLGREGNTTGVLLYPKYWKKEPVLNAS